jgi:hypothetical protein
MVLSIVPSTTERPAGGFLLCLKLETKKKNFGDWMKKGKIGSRFYKGILEDFIDLLKVEFRDDLVSLVLFGSIARGEGSILSDIDLLLILEKCHPNYHRSLDQVLDVVDRLKDLKVFGRIREKLGQEPFFSFLILSRKEAEENRYVFLDMINDAKILYDKNDFFIGRLKQLRKRIKELGSQKVTLEDGSWYWDLKPDLKIGDSFTL